MPKFASVVKLQPEERHSFRFLFLLSLITGIALSFYFVAVNTFLIKNSSISNLPYAYIISGLGGMLLIKVYQARQRKVGIIRSYKEFILIFSIVSLLVFAAYSRFGAVSAYSVYLAYFGFLFNMPFTIIFALSFSAICARLYNLSQSKRLLALIGTGEILASIIGYLIAPLISKLLSSPDTLLPVAAICILPAFFPIYKLGSENKERLNSIPVMKNEVKKLGLKFFLSEPFYILIAGASVLSVAAIYFVDYSYLITVRFMANYSGLEIAAIVGVFFSCVKAGELIFSFLSGHILSSKGAKFSILLLPVLLVGCFLFAAMSGAAFSTNPVFILCFIFLAKFVERVIRKGITTPAMKVVYQITGAERLRIEATIEGLLNQVATVLSGSLLLFISAFISREDTLYFLTVISGICFCIFLLWSLINLRLYESYKKKIWIYLNRVKAPLDADSQQNVPAIDVKEKALHMVIAYMPAIRHHIHADDKELINKKLSGTYYANNDFFYRIAVIRYFHSADGGLSLQIFKELWDVSDILLKSELINVYNKSGNRPTSIDLFYFEDLCQQISTELIYIMSIQNDLQYVEDIMLQSQLKYQNDLLTKVLFSLLKVSYDADAIQTIYEIIIGEDHQDIESKLFAIELLDNTLNDDLKDKLIPIFEPAPFEQKMASLQRLVPVKVMGKTDALKALLMKDFTLVNPYLKELCLGHYYMATEDAVVLNAFKESAIKNLSDKANQLLTNDNSKQVAKETIFTILQERYLLTGLELTLLYNNAIISPTQKYKMPLELDTPAGRVMIDERALEILTNNFY